MLKRKERTLRIFGNVFLLLLNVCVLCAISAIPCGIKSNAVYAAENTGQQREYTISSVTDYEIPIGDIEKTETAEVQEEEKIRVGAKTSDSEKAKILVVCYAFSAMIMTLLLERRPLFYAAAGKRELTWRKKSRIYWIHRNKS